MQYGNAGFFVSYREDGIIHYHFADISRATVDTWIEISHQHDVQAMESGKHLLRMTTAHPKLIPTPYALGRISQLDATSPKILESQAFIIANNIAYHLIGAFVNRMESQTKHAVRVCQSEEEGVAWLLSRVSEAPALKGK
jgi:hypothetical protein